MEQIMILYKQLICSNLALINQEILSYINRQQFDSTIFWNPVPIIEFIHATPKFTAWCLDNNMPLKSIAVTLGTNPNCCGPHIDTPPSIYKLSWPVLNTEHTWNRWFQTPANASTKINALGGISYLDPASLIEIGRMRVDQPAIIATGVPHDVWFESGAVFPRWGLQCQFFIEPTGL